MAEITRKEIKGAFPGKPVRIRRVDFTDLARASCYTVTVVGVNDGVGNVIPPEMHDRIPDMERLRALLAGKTYRGCTVIVA